MATNTIDTGSKDYLSSIEASNPRLFAPGNNLGQADFLRLLTTQMQNQDPTKPMDPTSFVTDLTQMSQLEATTKMHESIAAMTQGFQGMQTLQGAALIGKNVRVSGEVFSHTQGQSSQVSLNLDQPLTDVTVVISDDNGLVKEMDIGDVQQGDKLIDWNGMDNVDVVRASGLYKITAYGTDENGDLQSIDSVVPSRVNTVGINTDGSMTLTLATGEKVAMDAVREISG